MTLTDHVCLISESKLHKSILCSSSGGFDTKTQLQKCYLTGIWMRCNDSLGRGKHYCYNKIKSFVDSKASPKCPEGYFCIEARCSFKIRFWASSWHEEKNWDIETEDPETIHAIVSSFFPRGFHPFIRFHFSSGYLAFFLFQRIILLIILLMLVM